MTKILFWDIDGSLLRRESVWQKLNELFGITADEDQKLFDAYKQGGSYETWIADLNKLYRENGKANDASLSEVIEWAIKNIDPNAKNIIAELKNRGVKIALLTGSVNVVANAIAKEIGVEVILSPNKLIMEKGVYQIHPMSDEAISKLKLANDYIASLGGLITDYEVYCVGDGGNDEELFKKYFGITYPGTKMEQMGLAKKVIQNSSELLEILK